jgi:hypothetical protein
MKYDKDGYPIPPIYASIEEYEKAGDELQLKNSTKLGLLKNHLACLDEWKKQNEIINKKGISDTEMLKASKTIDFIEKRIEKIKRMLK